MARKQKRVPRAGFIPYYVEDGVVHMLMMRPSDTKYGGSDFQLAKGKVDEGETSLQAAIREASEELGLNPRNIVEVKYLGEFMGYTRMYFGEVIDKDDFGETTYETEETKWMTIDEFMASGRRIHRYVVRCFADEIIGPSRHGH